MDIIIFSVTLTEAKKGITISVLPATDQFPPEIQPYGVHITKVTPGSHGEAVGLRAGDVFLAANGIRLERGPSIGIQDFMEQALGLIRGAMVTVEVLRVATLRYSDSDLYNQLLRRALLWQATHGRQGFPGRLCRRCGVAHSPGMFGHFCSPQCTVSARTADDATAAHAGGAERLREAAEAAARAYAEQAAARAAAEAAAAAAEAERAAEAEQAAAAAELEDEAEVFCCEMLLK